MAETLPELLRGQLAVFLHLTPSKHCAPPPVAANPSTSRLPRFARANRRLPPPAAILPAGWAAHTRNAQIGGPIRWATGLRPRSRPADGRQRAAGGSGTSVEAHFATEREKRWLSNCSQRCTPTPVRSGS